MIHVIGLQFIDVMETALCRPMPTVFYKGSANTFPQNPPKLTPLEFTHIPIPDQNVQCYLLII